MLNVAAEAAALVRQEDGVEVVLIDPKTSAPIPIGDAPAGRVVRIVVAGPDSRRAMLAERDAWRHILTGRDLSGRISAEDIAAVQTRTLAGCVISWDGFSRDGTEILEPTTENVVAVFDQVAWVERQVREKFANRANFTAS